MTESRDGNDTGWETASSTSSTSTTSQLPPALIPVVQKRSKKRDKHSKPQRWGPPVNPLTQYWIERARLIKFLEKRFAKFQRKSREDYDRAKNPPRKQPAPTAAVPARQHLAPAVQQAVPAKQQAATAQTAQNPAVNHTRPNANQEVGTMNAAGAARGMLKRGVVGGAQAPVPAIVRPVASSSRTFTTNAPTLARKGVKNEYAMDLAEAARVLRAFEISSPYASYTLMIRTRDKTKSKSKHSAPLRGRVTLPMDPRKTSDTVLVFAEPNSPSRRLAEETGVTYLGGDDLFEPLLNGEITPTKVLSTPGMLPSVTQALARFLGPKGLMPTTRRGGVGEGEELVQRIKEAKGSLDWRADERGWIVAVIGRMNYPLATIEANVRAFVTSVNQGSASANPSAADEALGSRKASKKTLGLVNSVKLETTNCHSIELRDV